MTSNSRPASRAGAGRSNAARRVIVSLEFLPDNTSVQIPITNEFSSHLPLTDVQWKSSSRSTTRTIETLNLDFRSFRESTKDAPPQQIPINLLEKPYLHLMFVASDDNEAYRVTLRPQIREWLTTVQKRKLQEWLIVHVTSQKTGPAKFYLRKGSVFDKIRADFNVGKRDRVLQLPVPGSLADENTTDYSTIWRDFLSKAKESIILSFDATFTSYEEDVRKIDSQRQLPGWNFCTFFIQKEGLAHSFEAMNLLEDALLQYDELEASYYLGARDQTLPWFSRIGGNLDKDDFLSILSNNHKPYRDLIMQNDISVFDFRIYLFSRQASLVIGLGRVVDLAKRAKSFIYSMAKMLRNHHGLLKRYFIESWIYTASLEVVDKCHQLVNARKMNAAAIPDLLPILAELTELATRQVEKLGMIFGYLPRAHPFLMSAQSLTLDDPEDRQIDEAEEAMDTPSHLESSNAELQDSFRDEAKFDSLYRSMLDRVHEAWTSSMRMRSANKVKGTLAALEQARSNQKRALNIYADLVDDFSRTRWTAVEAQLLRQTVSLREGVKDAQGQTERLLSILALLRNGLSTGSLSWTLASKRIDGAEAASSWLEEARQLSQQLDKDFAVIDVPAFTVKLASSIGQFLDNEDGICVKLAIENHLPCTLDVDEIRLKLLNADADPLSLKIGPVQLNPGRDNIVTVSATTSLVGVYTLHTSQIRTSRIVFQHTHRNIAYGAAQSTAPHDLNSIEPSTTVRFTQDHLSVDISAHEALETSLDLPRQTRLVVHKGRGNIVKGIIQFSESFKEAQMLYETATTLHDNCSLESDSRTRSLTFSLKNGTEGIEIAIAYHSFARLQHIYLPLTMQYYTADRPEKRRLLRTCIRLRTALPLDVTVHDYRRDDFLLSKFTVSTVQNLPLRVKEALMEDSSQFRVVAPHKGRRRTVLVKRDQAGTFPFRLERETKSADSGTETRLDDMRMQITLMYRTIEADLFAIMKPHLSAIFEKHDIFGSRRLMEAIISLFAADIHLITHFNSLHTLDSIGRENVKLSTYQEPARLHTYRDSLCSFWTTEDEWDRIRGAIVEAYQTPVSTNLLLDEPWYSVSIPFEVPTVAIFNHVSLNLQTSTFKKPTRIGERIPCTLRIKSSLKWGSKAEQGFFRDLFNVSEDEEDETGEQTNDRSQAMLYEMRFNPHDWAIIGKTSSTFKISSIEGTQLEHPIELVPLRQGSLFVPSIVVLPIVAGHGQGRQGYTKELPDKLPSSETYQDDIAMCVEVVQDSSVAPSMAYDLHTSQIPHTAINAR